MKKRNMAIAMATVTAAGTVAPVFANVAVKNVDKTTQVDIQNESITTREYSSLEAQLKSVSGLTYDSTDLSSEVSQAESVYEMHYSSDGGVTTSSLTTISQFDDAAKKIANSTRGDEFIFTVLDKGHAKDSQGKITDLGNIELDQDLLYELKSDEFKIIKESMGNFGKSGTGYDNITNKEYLAGYLKDASVDKSTGEITLKFETPTSNKMQVNGKDISADFTVVLKSGEHKLDFSRPKFINDKLVGFEKSVEKIKPVEYRIKVSNVIKESMDINGKDADSVAEELNKQYEFKNINKDQIKEVNGKYQLTLEVTNIKLSKTSKLSSDVIKQIVLKADTKAELEDIVDALNNIADFTKVVGENRIDTSIEISSKYYNVNNGIYDSERNAVVLVNETSIVDGLSAAPLAVSKEAPVLLTKSDKLPKEVRDEMIRVMGLKNGVGANKTVYIVGGTSVVSEDIVKELEDMGLTVKRLSGSNRETTSVAVANELNVTDKVYVVDGYKGIADAMSISPVAAKEQKPIIVVNGKADLNENVEKTLKTMVSSEIIGGTNVVTKETERQIESAVISTTDRTEGVNRQDTNAEVIKKHYNNVEKFFVAKDGMDKEDRLVDALSIAPVAGKLNAPVILNTNSLTTEQAMAIDRVKSNSSTSLTQVGGGVAENVITQIKKVLGMK